MAAAISATMSAYCVPMPMARRLALDSGSGTSSAGRALHSPLVQPGAVALLALEDHVSGVARDEPAQTIVVGFRQAVPRQLVDGIRIGLGHLRGSASMRPVTNSAGVMPAAVILDQHRRARRADAEHEHVGLLLLQVGDDCATPRPDPAVVGSADDDRRPPAVSPSSFHAVAEARLTARRQARRRPAARTPSGG